MAIYMIKSHEFVWNTWWQGSIPNSQLIMIIIILLKYFWNSFPNENSPNDFNFKK